MKRLLLPLLLCAAPVLAQERVDLTPRWTQGEKCEAEAKLLVTQKVRLLLTGPKAMDHTSEQAFALLRRWQDEVAAVDTRGRPIEVRRRYSEDWKGEREPGEQELEREAAPLHQRRIVIDLDDAGERRVKPASDPPIERDALEDERFGERYEEVLPPEPKAIGESWTIEGEQLRAALGKGIGEEAEGQIVCTLKEIKEEALDEHTPAERYAIVTLQVTTTGSMRDGGQVAPPAGQDDDAPRMETELTGALRFSLAKKKIVTVELLGTARLRQTRKEKDAQGKESVLELDGKGPFELKKRFWFPERPKKK